jgi:hypothetical protein
MCQAYERSCLKMKLSLILDLNMANISIRGRGSPNATNWEKLSYEQLLAIVEVVDCCHNDTVTTPMIKNCIKSEFNIEVSERIVGRYFKKLG